MKKKEALKILVNNFKTWSDKFPFVNKIFEESELFFLLKPKKQYKILRAKLLPWRNSLGLLPLMLRFKGVNVDAIAKEDMDKLYTYFFMLSLI